jgi:ribosomal protein L35AE/L33A
MVCWSLSAFLLVASLAMAAEPKRIALKPGAPAVTLDGEVAVGKDVVFVFQARAGMKFDGRITRKSGNAGFAVTGPGGKELPEEEFDFNTKLTGTLEKESDYQIAVTSPENRAIQFTLVVRIDPK